MQRESWLEGQKKSASTNSLSTSYLHVIKVANVTVTGMLQLI